MAIHRRKRKAACDVLAHDRGHGPRVRARLQGRRKGRRHAGDPEDSRVDERFSALATYLCAGNLYECAWLPFRLGHFKGMNDEEAALALAVWARRNHFHIMFEVRRVRDDDVLFLLIKDSPQ